MLAIVEPSHTVFCLVLPMRVDRARDLIRESSHLRLILHEHVNDKLRFRAANARCGAYHEAARAINLYIYEGMR